MADEPDAKRQKLNDHVDDQLSALRTDQAADVVATGPTEGVDSEEVDEDGGAVCEEEAETPSASFSKETDVGIEQYLSSSHKGFFAILKQRCASALA